MLALEAESETDEALHIDLRPELELIVSYCSS